MANHSVTHEVRTLLAAGLTVDQINADLRIDVHTRDDGKTYVIGGRTDEYKLQQFAAPYAEIRFTKRNGQWCVRGIDITEGETVEVSKRDGSTSTVTVDKIIETDGAFKVATTVAKPRRAPRPTYCDHYETSNRGECYSCGAYVAADDLGGAYRPRRYRRY